MAALSHPHICVLYDVGQNYLVMDWWTACRWPGPCRSRRRWTTRRRFSMRSTGSPLNFHSPIPREIRNLANAGLSAMEALQSATLRAAQLQGVDAHVGTV